MLFFQIVSIYYNYNDLLSLDFQYLVFMKRCPVLSDIFLVLWKSFREKSLGRIVGACYHFKKFFQSRSLAEFFQIVENEKILS